MSDVYKYEAVQQETEEFKRIHAPMKAWYKSASLQSQLGDFPLFWRDLAAWPHYRVAFRYYNHWLEKKDAPKQDAPTISLAAVPIAETAVNVDTSSAAASLLSAATSGASLDETGGARKSVDGGIRQQSRLLSKQVIQQFRQSPLLSRYSHHLRLLQRERTDGTLSQRRLL
jgi:hypothetical protein